MRRLLTGILVGMSVVASASAEIVAVSGKTTPAVSPPAVLPAAALAHSKITLSTIAIEAGKLTVAGKTKSGKSTVTLDGKYHTKSASDGKFKFSLVYLPPTCLVTLKTSHGSDKVVVSDCGPQGSKGPAGPRGAAGPQGDTGPPGSANVAIRTTSCGATPCSHTCSAGETPLSATVTLVTGGATRVTVEPPNLAGGWSGAPGADSWTSISIALTCLTP